MSCKVLHNEGGVLVIVCNRGASNKRCKWCGGKATRLCDYPLTGAKRATCSIPMCDKCARPIGDGIDYCRVHAEMSRGK